MPTCTTSGCRRRKGVVAGGKCAQCLDEHQKTMCGDCKEDFQSKKQGMCCERCEVWFHLTCVNISPDLYDLLRKEDGEDDGFRWFCPTCRGKNNDASDNLKTAVQKEIKEVLPEIVKTVLTETKQCSQVLSQTFADIVKKQQNKMIDDTVKKTSNIALKESMKSLESNLAEKKRRTRNIVISGVEEDDSTTSNEIVFNLLKPLEAKLEKKDIIKVNRIGKTTGNAEADHQQSRKRPRLLHVVLRYEADAASFHNGGFGRRISEEKNIWINPDLTRSERDICYQRRVQKRQQIEKADEEDKSEDAKKD